MLQRQYPNFYARWPIKSSFECEKTVFDNKYPLDFHQNCKYKRVPII